jgi:hypothetical protein
LQMAINPMINLGDRSMVITHGFREI